MPCPPASVEFWGLYLVTPSSLMKPLHVLVDSCCLSCSLHAYFRNRLLTGVTHCITPRCCPSSRTVDCVGGLKGS